MEASAALNFYAQMMDTEKLIMQVILMRMNLESLKHE